MNLPPFRAEDYQHTSFSFDLPGEKHSGRSYSRYTHNANQEIAVFRVESIAVDWLLPMWEEDAVWALHGPVKVMGTRVEHYPSTIGPFGSFDVVEMWFRRA